MQKFLTLGAECLEVRETTDASKGTYLCFHGFFTLYPCLATLDLNLCAIILSTVSLANALARVTSLEAKLKTTSKAP
jgi:hypothetical protein